MLNFIVRCPARRHPATLTQYNHSIPTIRVANKLSGSNRVFFYWRNRMRRFMKTKLSIAVCALSLSLQAAAAEPEALNLQWNSAFNGSGATIVQPVGPGSARIPTVSWVEQVRGNLQNQILTVTKSINTDLAASDAVKSLNARIVTLEAEVAKLQAIVAELKANTATKP
jgi:uncharacterized small protein (DUF1192 family)